MWKFLLFLILLPVIAIVVLLLLFNFSPGFKRTFGKYFYNWLYGLKWGSTRTNNYGYGPAEAEATAYGPQEKYQLQLYREMAKGLEDIAWKDKTILEVGCGRGGGLHFLFQLLQPGHTTGIDFSQNAISDCQSHYAKDKERLHFVQGDALALPFDDEAFDIVFNVESSHIYSDQARFLREVARVLRRGGHFVIADYRPTGEGLARFHTDVQAAGLTQIHTRGISKDVLLACKADTARREALVANAPSFSRNYLHEFAMTDKSKEFENFERDYFYFITVYSKA
jgi:ubiquinone/menaquinone biosynthesis C-methylase UbiE